MLNRNVPDNLPSRNRGSSIVRVSVSSREARSNSRGSTAVPGASSFRLENSTRFSVSSTVSTTPSGSSMVS